MREEEQEVYHRLDEHEFYRLPTLFDIRDYDIVIKPVTISKTYFDFRKYRRK